MKSGENSGEDKRQHLFAFISIIERKKRQVETNYAYPEMNNFSCRALEELKKFRAIGSGWKQIFWIVWKKDG